MGFKRCPQINSLFQTVNCCRTNKAEGWSTHRGDSGQVSFIYAAPYHKSQFGLRGFTAWTACKFPMFSDPWFRNYSPSPKYLISLFSPQPLHDPWKFTCDPSVVSLAYTNQEDYGPLFEAILSQDYPSDNTHPHRYRLLLVPFSSSLSNSNLSTLHCAAHT